jgi:hypothetical protein
MGKRETGKKGNSVSRSVGWSVGREIGKLGFPVGRLVGWSVGRSVPALDREKRKGK